MADPPPSNPWSSSHFWRTHRLPRGSLFGVSACPGWYGPSHSWHVNQNVLYQSTIVLGDAPPQCTRNSWLTSASGGAADSFLAGQGKDQQAEKSIDQHSERNFLKLIRHITSVTPVTQDHYHVVSIQPRTIQYSVMQCLVLSFVCQTPFL